MQSCFYKSADGIDLHALYWRCDNPSSESCVLLLHGFTNDAHVWDEIAAELSREHHVLAPDFRGHGDSAWDPKARYSHWQLVADIGEFAQQFQFPRWHVVGHSLGARVAMLAIADGLLAAQSFVVIDAAPEVSAEASAKILNDALSTPQQFESYEAYDSHLKSLYVLASDEAINRLGLFGLRKRDKRFYTKMDPAFTPNLWHQSPELQEQERIRGPLVEKLWESLGKVKAPVLLLRGQASAVLTQAMAESLIESTLHDGQLRTVSRSGHALMIDNPTECSDYINQFLAAQSQTKHSIRRAS